MKKITFVVSYVNGGVGRVIGILANELVKRNYDVTVIFTRPENNPEFAGNPKIKVQFLDSMVKKTGTTELSRKLIMTSARFTGKLGFGEYSSVMKFLSRNYERTAALKKYFRENKNTTAIAFLYDAIFLTLLSAGKSNRVIISERGDPCQSLSSKTDVAFFKKMFPKADEMVFQSPDVKKWYNENTPVKGTVIFNPVKSDLPQPYTGERNKKIVNFCRISSQKNLTLLVESFSRLNREYQEYELYIYGNVAGKDGEDHLKKMEEAIKRTECDDKIHLLPASNEIHELIKDCAMFVSSSDFEGMSNSMLEAMAMGMPVVCTDCPAGGARAVIRDHENGILTPVCDANALYLAMKEVIENPSLAERMGKNAAEIRESQSVAKITEKWMEIING